MSDTISVLGVDPIQGQSPAGVNLSDLPESEPTLAEIAKLNAMDLGPDAVDWQLVDTDVRNLLANYGKHFQFAAYLAVARCQLDGVNGIAQGANLLKGMTENFWQDAYPPKKRVRGRINAIQWWLDWTNSWAEKFVQAGVELDVADIQAATDAIQNLECALVEEYDDAPVMRGLLNHLNRIPIVQEQTSAASSNTENGNAAAIVLSESQAVSQKAEIIVSHDDTRKNESEDSVSIESDIRIDKSDVENSQDTQSSLSLGGELDFNAMLSGDEGAKDSTAKQLLASSLSQLEICAEKLFEEDEKRELSYRLRRFSAWSKLDQLPPNDGLKTKVNAPSRQTKLVLKSAKDTGDALIWLRASESKIASNPYWLDLSFDSCQLLASLGYEFEQARREVEQSCASLIFRLPELPLLKFSDGTDFANIQTQSWLKGLQLSNDSQCDALDDVSKYEAKANELITANKIEQAMSYLKGCLLGESHQNQCRIDVKLAQLLQQAGYQQLALTQLSSILQQIEECRLDKWLPELALGAYKVAHECHLSLGQRDAANNFLNQIHLIDPAIAIRYFQAAK